MTDLVLPGDVRVAFSHLAMLGLAAILEDSGVTDMRVGWTSGLDARPIVSSKDLDWERASAVVHEHAERHADPESWTAATIDDGQAGLFSPRIRGRADSRQWFDLALGRRSVLDAIAGGRQWLDLMFAGALGEPAYWRLDQKGARLPDDGASRWEMKTRNRGEDFTRNRLYPLAKAVAERDGAAVACGLSGGCLVDEVGKNDVQSRTATGLAPLGPVDNALAWCALWGISLFPVTHQPAARSRTAGHAEASRRSGPHRFGLFHLPVPSQPMRLARLRCIAVSSQLAAMGRPAAERVTQEAALAWLTRRGIGAIVVFPIGEYGSASAPERRALLGDIIPLGG